MQFGVFTDRIVVVEFVAEVGGAGRDAVVDALVTDPAVRCRVACRVEPLAFLEESFLEFAECP